MTYNEFIQNIINTRGQWNIPTEEYKELHHIIPKCLGGKGDYKNNTFRKNSYNTNCIWLYPREHFIAHKLLATENPTNYRLATAWHYMFFIDKNGNKYEPTPEEYEELKIVYANSRKNFVFSEEAKQKISKANKGKHTQTPEVVARVLATKRKNGTINHTETTKQILRDKRLGKQLSAETKLKISASAKANPKCWVNNLKEQKLIKKDALQAYLQQGWGLGRLPVKPETREKLSKAGKGRACTAEQKYKISQAQKGNKACLGKIFIHKGTKVKRVNESDLQNYLINGWSLGRKDKNYLQNK